MSQKEQDIQNLLEAMNEALEDDGCSIDFPFFDFSDRKNEIIQKLGFEYEYFCSLLNRCMTRKLIEKKTLGLGYYDIALTSLGQRKALSGKNQREEHSMNIGQITINGPTQIGDRNIQNISNCFSKVEAMINEAHASDAEKKEAKSLLQKMTENPLLNTIISGLVSAALK